MKPSAGSNLLPALLFFTLALVLGLAWQPLSAPLFRALAHPVAWALDRASPDVVSVYVDDERGPVAVLENNVRKDVARSLRATSKLAYPVFLALVAAGFAHAGTRPRLRGRRGLARGALGFALLIAFHLLFTILVLSYVASLENRGSAPLAIRLTSTLANVLDLFVPFILFFALFARTARRPQPGTPFVAVLLGSLAALAAAPGRAPASERWHEPRTIHVFHDADVHFTPSDASKFDTPFARAEANGRVVTRTVELPEMQVPVRITAHVRVRPIPKDDESVWDKWDRAGNVRLVRSDGPDVELVKFVTAYGGLSEFEADVTHLAPLLVGRCTLRGFVDTWLSPAWRMDLSLLYEPYRPDTSNAAPPRTRWLRPLVYLEHVDADTLRTGPIEVKVDVPAGLEHVTLYYLTSGHCTDGRDADEFVTKANVVRVDGAEVLRTRPWRTDCRRFREINPYCRRWSDGSWSCDYDRSGWCPGDRVLPTELDVSRELDTGPHTVSFVIEDIRPRDADGNHGYWRVSSYLVGW